MYKRRNRIFILSIIVMLAFSALACRTVTNLAPQTVRGSGDLGEETHEVSGFSAVHLAGIGSLYVEFGDHEALHIEGDDILLQYIETEVRDGVLYISTREGVNLSPVEGIRYYLTVESLNEIHASGLGSVQAPVLDGESVSLEISGGGGMEIAGVQADRLSVDISGLGDLSIAAGEVAEQNVFISGGGNYEAEDLYSARANVDISGLGSVTLRVSQDLSVEISGSGTVRYYGDPSVTQDISGLGSLEQMGE